MSVDSATPTLAPHPSIFNEATQRALASLLSLSPGWYARPTLARAMAAGSGIGEAWAGQLLVRAGRAVPSCTLEFRGRSGTLKRSFSYVQPTRIVSVWGDFEWGRVVAPRLNIAPDLPDPPALSFFNPGVI